MHNQVFCLMGPTASGKTSLACELVERFPFEIISVDSALIYRGMSIGTAKPDADELARAPHHLIDIRNPDESYSAAEFCADAQALCEAIFQRGKIPLLVGGTMMYFNAFQQGLAVLPEADEAIRKQLNEALAQHGSEGLYQMLQTCDPITASRIHAHDIQRIQRALEVYYVSGVSMSALLAEQKKEAKYQFVNLALFPQNRSWLHARIAARFDTMLSAGFVAEVEQLQKQWALGKNHPSMRCVGYRQVIDYLQGEYDYSSMREKGIAATRQLAKRQLTWLRSWPDALYYDSEHASFRDEMMAKTEKILDNGAS